MRSIQVLFWQFLARHALFFGIVFLSQMCFALTGLLLSGKAALEGVVVLAFIITIAQLIYLMAVFGFGTERDLLDSSTTYPMHMLRLPVDSRWLALAPFFVGVGCQVMLLSFADCLVFGPARVRPRLQALGIPPIKWSIFFACLLAWLQAALWANYRSPWFRVVFLGLSLLLPIAWMSGLFVSNISEELAVGGLLTSIPLALATACWNLSRARRGECSQFENFFRRLVPTTQIGKSTTCPSVQNSNPRLRLFASRFCYWSDSLFRSPVPNQVWLEWKCHCQPIVVLCAALIGFFGVLSLSWPFLTSSRYLMLCTPVFLAAIGGIGLGRLGQGTDAARVTAFYGSRPFTSIQLVYSKWLAALLASFLLASLGVASFLLFTVLAGESDILSGWWTSANELYPTAQLIFGLVAGTLLYVFLLWALLVHLLAITLSGRGWTQTLAIASAIAVATVCISSVPASFVPWTFLAALLLKIALGTLAIVRIHKLDLLDDGTLFQTVAFWFLFAIFIAVAIFGFVAPFVGFGSILLIIPLALLFMPFSRLVYAPLALHTNRHR